MENQKKSGGLKKYFFWNFSDFRKSENLKKNLKMFVEIFFRPKIFRRNFFFWNFFLFFSKYLIMSVLCLNMIS